MRRRTDGTTRRAAGRTPAGATRAPLAALVLALGTALLAPRDARAQPRPGPPPGGPVPGPASSEVPAPLRAVAFEPPLGGGLPAGLALTDATGAEVSLAGLLGERPLVVVPVYYECPMLCSLVLDGLERALRGLRLAPGRDFDVVVFSIDPGETPARAARARDTFLERYGRPVTGRGVRFLTGEAAAIARLAEALGFRYERDPETGEFAHAAGLVVTTAGGRLARFLSGVDYPARDLRLALVEAGRGAVGDAVDRALLYCFRYDPSTGRYSAAVLGIVRAGGVLTVGALLAFVLWSRRRERAARGEGR